MSTVVKPPPLPAQTKKVEKVVVLCFYCKQMQDKKYAPPDAIKCQFCGKVFRIVCGR